MSKSKNNTIELGMMPTDCETVQTAVTDSDRHITYDPAGRPEVSNLVILAALVSGRDPRRWPTRSATAGAAG